MSNRKFHSCFIVDVEQDGNAITLTDSTRCRWTIDLTQPNMAVDFNNWMQQVFLKGVAQTLTVFEYEDRGVSPDFDFYIKKFCGLHGVTQLNG